MNFKEQRQAASRRLNKINSKGSGSSYTCNPPVNTMSGKDGDPVDLKPNKNFTIGKNSGGNTKTN